MSPAEYKTVQSRILGVLGPPWGVHGPMIHSMSADALAVYATLVTQLREGYPNGCGMQDCPRHFKSARKDNGDFYAHMGETCMYPRLKQANFEEWRLRSEEERQPLGARPCAACGHKFHHIDHCDECPCQHYIAAVVPDLPDWKLHGARAEHVAPIPESDAMAALVELRATIIAALGEAATHADQVTCVEADQKALRAIAEAVMVASHRVKIPETLPPFRHKVIEKPRVDESVGAPPVPDHRDRVPGWHPETD